MDIEKVDKKYHVENTGVIRSKISIDFRPLKPQVTKYGTLRVNLYSGGRKHKKHSVAFLVAERFVPNPNGYKKLKYKDGDKSNCDYRNLEWVKDNKDNEFLCHNCEKLTKGRRKSKTIINQKPNQNEQKSK